MFWFYQQHHHYQFSMQFNGTPDILWFCDWVKRWVHGREYRVCYVQMLHARQESIRHPYSVYIEYGNAESLTEFGRFLFLFTMAQLACKWNMDTDTLKIVVVKPADALHIHPPKLIHCSTHHIVNKSCKSLRTRLYRLPSLSRRFYLDMRLAKRNVRPPILVYYVRLENWIIGWCALGMKKPTESWPSSRYFMDPELKLCNVIHWMFLQRRGLRVCKQCPTYDKLKSIQEKKKKSPFDVIQFLLFVY